MKIKISLLIVVAALALVLVSCAGGGDLEGTSWQLVSFGGKAVLSGGAPTLFFEDGSVGGNAGCNTFGGEYSLRGSQIKFDALFSTLMACVDNDRMAQETAYMQMLGQASQYKISDGQLILTTTDGETLVFTPAN